MEKLRERLAQLEKGWSDDLPRLTRYENEAEKCLLRLITSGQRRIFWDEVFRPICYAVCGFTPPVGAVLRRYESSGVLHRDYAGGGWLVASR